MFGVTWVYKMNDDIGYKTQGDETWTLESESLVWVLAKLLSGSITTSKLLQTPAAFCRRGRKYCHPRVIITFEGHND